MNPPPPQVAPSIVNPSPDKSFPNAWPRPWPRSVGVWFVESVTCVPVQVPVGELEAFRGPPVPPQVAPSVVVTPEHLLEFAFGAAINAELIIIAATRTTAVLPMSLAFMTALALSPLSIIASAFGNT